METNSIHLSGVVACLRSCRWRRWIGPNPKNSEKDCPSSVLEDDHVGGRLPGHGYRPSTVIASLGLVRRADRERCGRWTQSPAATPTSTKSHGDSGGIVAYRQ